MSRCLPRWIHRICGTCWYASSVAPVMRTKCYLSNAAAAAGIGLINTIGTLAGFLGPYATGWLHDVTGSYRVPMLGVAALMCMSAPCSAH
jgi:cyanate permease